MTNDYNYRLKKIEEQVYSLLPSAPNPTWVQDIAGLNTETVSGKFSEYISKINIPAIDLIERGGKRWRPMLMLLLYEAKQKEFDKILPLTPIVELAHNGSLIVDDIEDGADLRRGKPAVHITHGTDMSINTGNFLYFLAAQSINNTDFDRQIKYQLADYYMHAMTRLHIGQGLDIQWHNNHIKLPDEQEYLQMCRFKTGALARFSAEAAIIAAGGSSKEAHQVGSACENLGVAFQIFDDIINLTVGNPGKKRGDDIVEGKKSLPVILYMQNNGDIYKLAGCFSDAQSLEGESRDRAIENAIELLGESGSIEIASKKAFQILYESREVIQNQYEQSIAKELIFFILDSFSNLIK